MKTTTGWLVLIATSVFGMLLVAVDAQAQEVTVRGRVTLNPIMNECLDEAICLREMEMGFYPEADWVPPTAAVNIIVRGTDRVAKTDRQGNYQVTVPSPNTTLVFTFIGYTRTEVPVAGRSVVDVKLTPMPQPVVERLLEVIMPELHAGRRVDIDQLAQQGQVNRETARDILWLVMGNRPFVAEYPGEFYPDYRFEE